MQFHVRIPALPRLLTGLAVVVLATVLSATIVSAQQSQPLTRDEDSLSTSESSPRAGESFSVVGAGFAPGATVDFTLEPGQSDLGSAVADATGEVSATLTVPPSTEPGNYVLRATGAAVGGGINIIEMDLQVEPAAAGIDGTPADNGPTADGGTTLPRTGGDTGVLALAGALSIVGGAVLLIARRRVTSR